MDSMARYRARSQDGNRRRGGVCDVGVGAVGLGVGEFESLAMRVAADTGIAVSRVFAFGSRARGGATAKSGVDVVIVPPDRDGRRSTSGPGRSTSGGRTGSPPRRMSVRSPEFEERACEDVDIVATGVGEGNAFGGSGTSAVDRGGDRTFPL